MRNREDRLEYGGGTRPPQISMLSLLQDFIEETRLKLFSKEPASP